MGDLLATHRALLERWRKSMNLVGPGDVQVHYDDCTLALGGLQPQGHWVDLGSGAGFPGVVLAALWPDLRVDLVDSRQKRCVFLNQVLGEAAVPTARVQVLRQRVEDLKPDDSSRYDGVVARAFTAPAEVVAHAERLLRPGGLCVLFLQEGAEVPAVDGFTVFHVEHYEVDGKQRKAVSLQRA